MIIFQLFCDNNAFYLFVSGKFDKPSFGLNMAKVIRRYFMLFLSLMNTYKIKTNNQHGNPYNYGKRLAFLKSKKYILLRLLQLHTHSATTSARIDTCVSVIRYCTTKIRLFFFLSSRESFLVRTQTNQYSF